MKIILISVFSFLFITVSLAEGPGQPFFPETASGASNVGFYGVPLRWQNPTGTFYNEVYLDFDSAKVANLDSSSLFISGYPDTAFDSIAINQYLSCFTRYFWRVVEYNSTGYTPGEIWYFTTGGINIDLNKCDDFSFGLGEWVIDNTTECGWQLGEETDYTLPDPSTGNVLAANASLCGSPVNGAAYFQEAENMNYMVGANLDFNSDWNTDNAADYAMVQMSTNGGISWSTIWEQMGISDRNKHVTATLFNEQNDSIIVIALRFVTLQNDTNSWWAVDNIAITAYNGILTHYHPYIMHLEAVYDNQPATVIKWVESLPAVNGIIQRKDGTPLSNNSYETIAEMQTNYYNTYIDSTVNDSTTYTYRIGLREMSYLYVFSNEATAYVFPPIPVELFRFAGEVIESGIKLDWETATETNNRGFEVQRSKVIDKRSEWEKIGFVGGNGTITEPRSYSFKDVNVPAGKYSYRLKQIDFDGTYKYSDIVEVNVNIPIKFTLEQNFPNPFNPITIIRFSIPIETQVNLSVYNLLGERVKEMKNEVMKPGYYEVEFNPAALASGVYVYRIIAGDFIQVKKMLLLK